MEPAPRPSFDPVWAGAILVSGVAFGIGVGALIGWAIGYYGGRPVLEPKKRTDEAAS